MTTENGGYTDDEMSVLTPEEREALGAIDADDGTEGGDEQPGAEAKAEGEQASGDGAVEPGKESATQDAPAGGEGWGGKDAGPAAQQTAAFPNFEAPKDADATLKEIRASVDKLDEAFDLGEITAAEHRAQTRELDAQEREIRDAMLMAQMSERARLQAYQTTVESFLAANPEYEQGSQKYHLLDAELRRRQNAAPGAGRDPLDPSLIAEAHVSLQELFGGTSRKEPSDPTPTPTPKPQPKPGRDLPPSIAGLPAADMQSVTEGAFAGLARLNGEEFEAAFARLSEAQRDLYLAQAN